MFPEIFQDFSKTIHIVFKICAFKIDTSHFVNKFIRHLDNIRTWFEMHTRIATHQEQFKLKHCYCFVRNDYCVI